MLHMSLLSRIDRRLAAALGVLVALVALSAAPGRAKADLLELSPTEKPVTLVRQAPKPGTVQPLTAATRYVVQGSTVAAPVRARPGSYVIGELHGSDAIDVTNRDANPWYFGGSFRGGCSFVNVGNTFTANVGSSSACANSSSGYGDSIFMSAANCPGCNTYTDIGPHGDLSVCENLTVPVYQLTASVHAGCRDPKVIPAGHPVGWRYYTRDGQWIAIKDGAAGDSNGAFNFIPTGGVPTPCNPGGGCYYP